MSVEHWEYTGEEQVRSLRNGQEITRPINILTNDPDDSIVTLRRDIPSLQRWQPHPFQTGFFVDEFEAQRKLGTPWWIGTVRWIDSLSRNPLDEPVKISLRSETLPGATILNRKGEVIRNSAGDLVLPIDKPERIRIFVFRKNLPEIYEWMTNLEDVVNSGPLRIGGKPREARTCLLRQVEFGEAQTEDDTLFYPTTFEIAYRQSKWNHRYPSVGYSELVDEKIWTPGPDFGTTRKVLRRILVNGEPPTEPKLLDADGKWIRDPQPSDVVILEEEIYHEADLSVLPLS